MMRRTIPTTSIEAVVLRLIAIRWRQALKAFGCEPPRSVLEEWRCEFLVRLYKRLNRRGIDIVWSN